jgi:hypothetical protein
MVACHECGQSLNEFLYELIEVHPHKTGTDIGVEWGRQGQLRR